MENKVWNVFYSVSHNTIFSEETRQNIYAVDIEISKNEIIKETPKKFKMKFTSVNSSMNSWRIGKKEKLVDKTKVKIGVCQTLEDAMNTVEKQKKMVKESDKIAEFQKKAILKEYEKITMDYLENVFWK